MARTAVTHHANLAATGRPLVFLEVNPVGQWYWFGQATAMPILKGMIELLLFREISCGR